MVKRLLLLSLLLGLWATSADAFRVRGSGGSATAPPSAGFLATETFINTTGSATPANWPHTRNMAFRRGDVAGTQHPEIRLASGSTCSGTLLTYQWDEIATYKENGQTGGYWRMATYTVWMPNTVAPGAKVTLAFCSASGAYSATPSSITAAALCAAHPFSITFNNVQNQDNSTRNSGTMTWNLTDYCNTALVEPDREKPIEVANGLLRHSWVFRGSPVYATTSAKDPMTYVRYYVDAFSTPGSPSVIDRVRHVAEVSSPWMQVAAGSRGVATATSCSGGLCPQGFTGDPQAIYYTPVLKDGATTLVDYDALFSTTISNPTVPQNTVNAASTTSPGIGAFSLFIAGAGTVPGIAVGTIVTNTTNPGSIPANCYITDMPTTNYQLSCVTAAGSRGNGVQTGDNLRFETYWAQLNTIAGTPATNDFRSAYFQSAQSSGSHLYYVGAAFWYTTTGTPPAGMTSGTMLFPSTLLNSAQAVAGDRFQLTTSPNIPINNPAPFLQVPTSLGTGTQSLSYRVFGQKFKGWFTADTDGQSRWTGSVPTDPFKFNLDQGSFTGERLYLEQTGTIPPITLANCPYWGASFVYQPWEYTQTTFQYQPQSLTLALGGTQGGEHNYIGPIAEWSARWFCSQDPVQEKSTLVFALDGDSFPATVILNDATGRLPTTNNGPPSASGGGTGTPYTNLGALYPNIAVPLQPGYFNNVTEPSATLPGGGNAMFGWQPGGIFQDHQSAYNVLPPMMWGDRHYRDLQQTQTSRVGTAQYDQLNGPNAETRPNKVFTFPAGSGTPPAGKSYYGSIYPGNTFAQGPRAGAWMARALYMTAGAIADNDPMQPYFFDLVKENANWWADMALHKDCSSTTPYVNQPGIWSHSAAAAVNNSFNQQFMNTYNIMGQYYGWTMLRSPDVADRFGGAYLAAAQQVAGTSGWPTSTPPIYMGSFAFFTWANSTDYYGGKCKGLSAPSASQFWDGWENMVLDTSNGTIFSYHSDPGGDTLIFTPGDLIMNWNQSSRDDPRGLEDGSTGGPGVITVLGGPDQLPANVAMCIVSINNTDHTFKVAPPSPTCATPGATITSFTATGPSGWGSYCIYAPPSPLPAGMNPATSKQCIEGLGVRIQSPTYPPANTGYLWWSANGMHAVMAAGFSTMAPYAAQADTVAIITNVNASNAAFDWDKTIVVP